MSLYLYINLAIIIFPLIFSFERRIKYYSKIKSVLLSIVSVGAFFIAWDAFATYRGHWSFNPDQIGGLKLFGLPIEEILFFVTVPYSCLFIFESIVYFFRDRRIFSPNKWLFVGVGVAFILISFGFYSKEYTFLAMLSVGFSILLVSFFSVRVFSSRAYWAYIFVTFWLFFIFNYVLTSIPVVEYSPSAISGLRVITIPIEDFMFNFSMLTMYLAVYLLACRNSGAK